MVFTCIDKSGSYKTQSMFRTQPKPALIRARAFLVIKASAGFVCSVAREDVPAILQAAATSMAPQRSSSFLVRATALQVFARYFSSSTDPALKESLLLGGGALQSIALMLQDAEHDILNLAMETFCVIMKQCPGALEKNEQSVKALVGSLWRRCLPDHMTYLQMLDVVNNAAGSSSTLQGFIEAELLPAVLEGLQQPQDSHATACSVELLEVLLKRASIPLNSAYWSAVEVSVATVMRSDDSLLLQNACGLLGILIRRTPRQVVEGGALPALLQCVDKVLSPLVDDDACMAVGPLIVLLLNRLGDALSPELRAGLLKALALRLAAAATGYLRRELTVVLARLLLEDVHGVCAVLANVGCASQSGTQVSGLDVWLGFWLDNVEDIRAKSARSITLAAARKLHEKCMSEASFANSLVGKTNPQPLSRRLLETILWALEYENSCCRRQAHFRKGDSDDEDAALPAAGNAMLAFKPAARTGAADAEEESDEEISDEEEADPTEGDATLPPGELPDPWANLDIRRRALEHLEALPSAAAGNAELLNRIRVAVASAKADLA
eukprot:TRINITY_DN15792_c0_g1_i1.p1 TRINITY_DN15792_c0_g1~~TRINITY_DN15792_c0_g1_i1.p1  ORF type:complete len:555 (+),score=115.40 TRINITY_DN15792_c0_g1_i1:110-1774(+)